jgi:pimeloyl-ACP methyl ester carboxylesterase
MKDSALNYRIVGNGPPLLLVHGFGISFNIWDSIVTLLCPYFALIMIELPGIGSSPLPEKGKAYLDQAVEGIEDLRNCLNIERWTVFSYSSGTRVAERYIQSHPLRVERAVFLCAAQVSDLLAVGLSFALKLDGRFPQFGNWLLSGSRLKFLINLLAFNLKKSNLSAGWFAEMGSQPAEILRETLRSLIVHDQRSFNIPPDLPAIFIWGKEDWIAPAPIKLSPSADYVIHANHSAPQTKSREIVDIALPFLLSK